MKWAEHPVSHVLTIVFSMFVGLVGQSVGESHGWNEVATGVLAGYLSWATLELGIITLFRAASKTSEVPPVEHRGFTEDIRDSEAHFWAVSSKDLGLWSTPTFLEYLVLNGLKALTSYSQHMASPIVKLSSERRDKEALMEKAFDLARRISEGRSVPAYYYGLRLLIYPKEVYEDKARGEVLRALIKSLTLCRVHCIPLELEKVQASLSASDIDLLTRLARRMNQSAADGEPPPPPIVRAWRSVSGWGKDRLVVPDFLLVDESDLWWYEGEKDKHIECDKGTFRGEPCDEAIRSFKLLCGLAARCKWDNFTADWLGEIAVPDPNFFATGTYEQWYQNLRSKGKGLGGWFQSEDEELKRLFATHPQARVLDVGCGFGRHMVLALEEGASFVAGVDSNVHMVRRAQDTLLTWIDKRRDPELRRKFDINCEDASRMSFADEEFDVAICMTNTFGNFAPTIRNRVLAEIHRVLKPDGVLLASVYKADKEVAELRVMSYEDVGLTVRENYARSDVIETVEGLVSAQFHRHTLQAELNGAGFGAVDVKELAGVGHLATGTRASFKSGPS